jgi:hypothetical protein
MLGRTKAITFAMALALGASACSDGSGPTGRVRLSAAQADAVLARAEQIAIADHSLDWLRDSLEIVIHAGTEVKRITIRIDGTDRTYHAVGLNRVFVNTGATNSAATFHLLAFDDVSNPVKFVIVNGFQQNGTTTPPTTASGAFGSAGTAGHIIEIENTGAYDWIMLGGTSSFASAPDGAPCEGFTPANGISCFESALSLSFFVGLTQPPSVLLPGKTASLELTDVPAVTLRFLIAF